MMARKNIPADGGKTGHVKKVKAGSLPRLLLSAVQAASEAILLADRQGLICYVNKAFERLTGYSQAEALKQNPRLLNSGLQTRAFYRDLWGTLAGGIAHDFNNLLTIINGYAEMVLAESPGGRIRENVQSIYNAGEKAARLISHILAFSRKQIINPRVWNVNGAVRELQQMIRGILGEGIALEIDLAAHPEARILLTSGYMEKHAALPNALDRPIDFISKPFNRQELLEKIGEILDKKN